MKNNYSLSITIITNSESVSQFYNHEQYALNY